MNRGTNDMTHAAIGTYGLDKLPLMVPLMIATGLSSGCSSGMGGGGGANFWARWGGTLILRSIMSTCMGYPWAGEGSHFFVICPYVAHYHEKKLRPPIIETYFRHTCAGCAHIKAIPLGSS